MATVDIFSTQTMLEAVETIQAAPAFMADMMFSQRQFSDSEEIVFDKHVEVETLATYNDRGAPGRIVARESFDTKVFKPPYISEYMRTDAIDIINHRRLGAVPFAPRQSISARAAEQVAMDLAKLRRRIDRRIEQMACGVMETGKITISATQELDFGLPAANVYGTGDMVAVWDNANAEPLTDIDVAMDQIEKTSQYFPDTCVMGVNAARQFLKHDDVKGNLDTRRIDRGEISPERLAKGVKYLGNVDGIDFYSYARTYDVSGTATRYWPAKKVVLFSSQAMAKRHFGAIYNLEAGLTQIDFFPSSWEKDNPSARYIMLESSPVTAHYEMESVAVLTVLT